jgi:hypothetical protein
MVLTIYTGRRGSHLEEHATALAHPDDEVHPAVE